MGGWGSGRSGGRPIADLSCRIQIGSMIRTGRAMPGKCVSGTLSWSYGPDDPAGSVGYECDMVDCFNSMLTLRFTHGSWEDKQDIVQVVRLVFTEPNYGGKRWWMVCPFHEIRVGTLYLPNGGDRFASRKAWRLGYQSQRIAHSDRPFEKLLHLQKKLGSDLGWGACLQRPSGMWHRTYLRHFEKYLELDAACGAEMVGIMALLKGRISN